MESNEQQTNLDTAAPQVVPPATEQIQPSTSMPMPTPVKRFNKKIGLIAAIVAVIIVIGGGASAYAFWYQNPENVMIDAVSHLMTQKQAKMNGTVSLSSKEIDLSVALKSSGNSEKGSTMSADVTITPKAEEMKSLGQIKVGADAVVATNGDIYFKAKDVASVVNKIVDAAIKSETDTFTSEGIAFDQSEIDSMRSSITGQIQPVVDQIDNKWIKVSAADMKQQGNDTQTCVMDAVKKAQTDASSRKELIDAYKKNKFVTVDKELGTKNGTVGYQLKFDQKAGEAFGKQVENTSLGKALKSCDKDAFTNDDSDNTSTSSNTPDVTAEIWVTRFTHQLSEIKAHASDSDMTLMADLNFEMGKSDTITIPSNATNFKDLESNISDILSGAAAAAATNV